MSEESEFLCSHCGVNVSTDFGIGTKTEIIVPNVFIHCMLMTKCLAIETQIVEERWSQLGFTFKQEGLDKYGKEKQGEIMLIHKCQKCGKVNINRIAGDDDADQILKIYNLSKENIELSGELKKEGVLLLDNLAKQRSKTAFGLTK